MIKFPTFNQTTISEWNEWSRLKNISLYLKSGELRGFVKGGMTKHIKGQIK